jgi:hypothetical protein
MLEPKTIQAALNRAQIRVVISHSQYTMADYWQQNVDAYFPPALRHQVKILFRRALQRFSGKSS